MRQDDGGAVTATVDGEPPPRLAEQLARLLSLDVDASQYPAVAAADPVVAPLAAATPGSRPVSFWSPYEAACWAVLSQRTSMVAAAAVKERIAARFGSVHDVEGVPVSAFPTPARLAEVAGELLVPVVKQSGCAGSPRPPATSGWTGGGCGGSPRRRRWPRSANSPASARSPQSSSWSEERRRLTSSP